MKKLLFVFGTRPEAIKMAPLIREFSKFPDLFVVKVCVTGQQREMLDQALSLFQIVPDYDLQIMQPGQDLCRITSRVLTGLNEVLENVIPDLVVVQGDTTTTFTAALSAFYHKIPVIHIEAGLRTFDRFNPFPEEINRCLTSSLTTWHFAPTAKAKQNLLNENIPDDQIIVSGNTVIDALQWIVKRIRDGDIPEAEIIRSLCHDGYDTSRLHNNRKLILVTGHRRENFGEGFRNICHAIRNISVKYSDIDLVWPVHLNPNVLKPVSDILDKEAVNKNVFLIKPLNYISFIYLMDKSYLVLTDSGGLQEEAPALGKPVLVMRDTTERPEGVEAGTVRLVGTERENIESGVSALLTDPVLYKRMSQAVNPYGDGKAAEKIVSYFMNLYPRNDP